MLSRLAARAALVAVLAAALPAQAGERLTLDDAFARVAALPSRPAPARRCAATCSPPSATSPRYAPRWCAGAELENALGSGDYSGLDRAELTLTPGLGARTRRQARRAPRARAKPHRRAGARARSRAAWTCWPKSRAATSPWSLRGAQRDIAARRHRAAPAHRRRRAPARCTAGASPESVRADRAGRAGTRRTRSRRAQQAQVAARQHLAALWGERDPRFDIVAGDPLALPAIADFDALAALLRAHAGARALRRRAPHPRSAAATGAHRRPAPTSTGRSACARFRRRRRRRAGRQRVDAAGRGASRAAGDPRRRGRTGGRSKIEREVQGLSLYSTLVEAHGRYRVAQLEVAAPARRRAAQAGDAPKPPPNAPTAPARSATSNGRSCSPNAPPTRTQQLDAALSTPSAP